MTKQLKELFKGADLHHSESLINHILKNAGSGGWLHIHSSYLTQLFKSSVTRQRCLKILIDNGIIERSSHYHVGKSVKRYRIVDSSRLPSIQEEEIDLPTIQEEEFFVDQQQEDQADLVVYEGIFPDILNKFHSKYRTQAAELIRITDKDIRLYKESKDWVEKEYFSFDADAQRDRCLGLGLSESKVNFLIAKTLENGSVQQKV